MQYIYSLSCPITNDIKYIGVTKNTLKIRLYGHLHSKSNGLKAYWVLSLKKKKLKPKISLLEIVPKNENAGKYENKWITHFEKLGCYLFNINNI